jgi:hypothetical protein
MSVCVYSVFVLFSVNAEALRRADPPSKEFYQLCIGSRNWKRGQGPTTIRRIIIHSNTIIILIIKRTWQRNVTRTKELVILSESVLNLFLLRCSLILVAKRREKRRLGRVDIGERIILKYISATQAWTEFTCVWIVFHCGLCCVCDNLPIFHKYWQDEDLSFNRVWSRGFDGVPIRGRLETVANM